MSWFCPKRPGEATHRGLVLPISVMNDSQERNQLIHFLDARRIGNRLLFGGNLTKQPYFKGIPHRISGCLPHTDEVMNKTFWLGVYPGLTEAMIGYMSETLHDFYRKS